MLLFATATAIDLTVDPAGTAPEWVKVMPMGDIRARDGRQWKLADTTAARTVIGRTEAWYGSADPMIDYDHQIVPTLKQAPGATAKAAGWIKELAARDDGIYARVDWTPAGAAAIVAKEYRYVSPYFTHDADGNVQAIVNVALVNRPAMDLPALAAAQLTLTTEMSTMDKELLAALGLAETATLEDVLKAIAAATASATIVKTALAAAGLPETAKPEDLTKKIGDLVKAGTAAATIPDPNAYVPRAMFDELAGTVATMKEATATSAATSAVDAAIAAGKLAPAQKDWAMAYAAADLGGFEKFAASAPAITTASGASALPPGTPAATAGLSAEEAAVATMLGISPEDMAKNKGAK